MVELEEIKKLIHQVPDCEAKNKVLNLLVEMQSQCKSYMLRHKKSKEILRLNTDLKGWGNDSEIDYYLDMDKDQPIYYIDNLMRAAYIKYLHREWYSSSLDIPRHNYSAEELEIVDVYGKVYNIKPVSDYAIFKILGWYYKTDEYEKMMESNKKCVKDYDPKNSYSRDWYGYLDILRIKERYSKRKKK